LEIQWSEFEQAIEESPISELPALIGMLARLSATANLRISVGHAGMDSQTDELLTIPEVAQRLKVSDYRAYQLARQGVLKSIRLGKSVRVKPSAVAEYLSQHGG